MALSLVIAKTGINADGTEITITDQTGVYDASTNPGGYGTPNPERTDLALFLRVFAKRYNKTETLESTNLTTDPDSSDPLVVANWDCTLLSEKDSWIQATIYGLQLYAASTGLLFEVGELCYDVDSASIVKILTREEGEGYTYTSESVTEADLDNESYSKAYTTILNTYAIPQICFCKYRVNKCWQTTQTEENFQKYNTIDAYITAVQYAFGFGSYAEGQQMIETVEDLCTCFNEDCDCNC